MSLHGSTLSPVSPLPVVTSYFRSSASSTTTPILLLFSWIYCNSSIGASMLRTYLTPTNRDTLYTIV
eukprot:4892-Heterococcus_DN1.PRE.3